MYLNKFVYIVVPAYNEEKLISRVISSIPDYIDKIIVIDDGSTDRTSEVVNSFINKRIILIRHEKNRGVGASIATGYSKALELGADITAVMAGDAQMDPAYLPRLFNPIIEGQADYTKGNRLLFKSHRESMPRFRLMGNAVLSFLTKISSGYWHVMDPQNGYTAISHWALEKLDLESIYEGYGYCNDILIKLNVFSIKVKDVEIPAVYGEEKSKIKVPKYTLRLSYLLTKKFFWRLKEKYVMRDFHPLVLFYLFGFLLFPLGILLGLDLLYYRITAGSFSVPSVILTALLIITGLQFILFAMFFDMEANRMEQRI